jgi:hypothetical protein
MNHLSWRISRTNFLSPSQASRLGERHQEDPHIGTAAVVLSPLPISECSQSFLHLELCVVVDDCSKQTSGQPKIGLELRRPTENCGFDKDIVRVGRTRCDLTSSIYSCLLFLQSRISFQSTVRCFIFSFTNSRNLSIFSKVSSSSIIGSNKTWTCHPTFLKFPIHRPQGSV